MSPKIMIGRALEEEENQELGWEWDFLWHRRDLDVLATARFVNHFGGEDYNGKVVYWTFHTAKKSLDSTHTKPVTSEHISGIEAYT